LPPVFDFSVGEAVITYRARKFSAPVGCTVTTLSPLEKVVLKGTEALPATKEKLLLTDSVAIAVENENLISGVVLIL